MLLTVKDLTKKFNHKIVVNNINLSINQGDLVAFLGPNGAGKSTTINMLTGIIPPTTGIIKLDGLQPSSTQYHQKIGVVFQNSVLDNELTVKENLLSRQKMYRNSVDKLDDWIDKFALQSILNQKYGVLSGGQKRRVDIVRALIHDPELLFLDEPTTGLDIQTRKLIWKVLSDLRKETKLTIVLTTHYLEEAELADFVYVIDHGQVIAADTVNNLKQNFAQDVLTIYPSDMMKISQILSDYKYQIDGQQVAIFVQQYQAIDLLNKLKPVINSFEYRRGNMDDIFLNLTGKGVE
ncbi:ABC transporter ATP-binding protein [Companilactobacillus kimchiensis]|nr:ABC transporter ATP-binding protein [Companilactobacillus kimchiensis]